VSLACYALVAAVIVKCLRGATVASVIAVSALCAVPLIEPAMMAWSEPLKLLLLVSAVVSTERFARQPSRRRLALLAIPCALAPLAHLTGLAGAAGAAAALLAMRERSIRARVISAGVTLGVAAVAEIGWILYASGATGGLSQKKLAWHPTVEPGFIWAVGLLLIAAFELRASLRAQRPAGIAAAAMSATGLVILVGSRFLVDKNIALDRRQLQSSVVLLLLGALMAWGGRLRPVREHRGIAALAGLALLAGPVTTAVMIPRIGSSDFLGYRAPRWADSPLLAAVQSAATPPIWTISNAPDAIALLTRGLPIGLPRRDNLYTGKPNSGYLSQLAALRCAAAKHNAVVAFFYRPTRGHRRTVDESLLSTMRLRQLRTFTDGLLFAVDTAGCSRESAG
jgi:hypothetical protein